MKAKNTLFAFLFLFSVTSLADGVGNAFSPAVTAYLNAIELKSDELEKLAKQASTKAMSVSALFEDNLDISCQYQLQLTKGFFGWSADLVFYEKGFKDGPWENSNAVTLSTDSASGDNARLYTAVSKRGSGDVDLKDTASTKYSRLYINETFMGEKRLKARITIEKTEDEPLRLQVLSFYGNNRASESKWCLADKVEIKVNYQLLDTQNFISK